MSLELLIFSTQRSMKQIPIKPNKFMNISVHLQPQGQILNEMASVSNI